MLKELPPIMYQAIVGCGSPPIVLSIGLSPDVDAYIAQNGITTEVCCRLLRFDMHELCSYDAASHTMVPLVLPDETFEFRYKSLNKTLEVVMRYRRFPISSHHEGAPFVLAVTLPCEEAPVVTSPFFMYSKSKKGVDSTGLNIAVDAAVVDGSTKISADHDTPAATTRQPIGDDVKAAATTLASVHHGTHPPFLALPPTVQPPPDPTSRSVASFRESTPRKRLRDDTILQPTSNKRMGFYGHQAADGVATCLDSKDPGTTPGCSGDAFNEDHHCADDGTFALVEADSLREDPHVSCYCEGCLRVLMSHVTNVHA